MRSLSVFCGPEQISEACNGAEAIERVKQSMESGFPFDCILMDASMPEMNGLEATEILRRIGFKGFIFGTTGDTSEELSNQFIANGANEVLPKPITEDKYHQLILRCLPGQSRRLSQS
jgi:CheY-like chemotaxis protein